MKTAHHDGDRHSEPSLSPQHSPWQKPVTYFSMFLLGSGVTFSGAQLLRAQNPLSPGLPTSQAAAPAPPNVQGRLAGATDSNFITSVVNQVGPAVVRINASRTVTTQVPDALNDPFFRQFFGSQLPSQPETRVERGKGSGFIIDGSGKILTNAHVVDGADTVDVILKDGRSFTGKVLGTDPVTDVAVVKIEGENLPTVALGNSEQLQPGEWAIAIGNPLGLS